VGDSKRVATYCRVLIALEQYWCQINLKREIEKQETTLLGSARIVYGK
jgi:hypothetical protein